MKGQVKKDVSMQALQSIHGLCSSPCQLKKLEVEAAKQRDNSTVGQTALVVPPCSC